MRFLKNLVLLLLVLVVLVLGGAFLLPSSSHVERSVTINRPPSEVFLLLDGYRRFNEWSPWAAKDPNAKYTLSGPAHGVGAKLSWVGDPNTVGTGSQEIAASVPNESVATALVFGDTMQARAQFVLTPEAGGGSTQLKWTFDADLPLTLDRRLPAGVVGRYFGLMMDRIVGTDYEQGLKQLKLLLERMPAADVSGIAGNEIEHAAQPVYWLSASSAGGADAAKSAREDAFAKLHAWLDANGIAPAGAPMTITDSDDANGWKFEAALPVEHNDVAGTDEIKSGTTYAGKAVEFVHVGPYATLGDTVHKAYAWLALQGYKTTDRRIEEYVGDPGAADAKTRIVVPVQ